MAHPLKDRFDVVICGCGPAGSLAGLVLARQGRSVLMLDRALFPRPKLCGGLLTWKAVRLLESVTGQSPAQLMDAGVINHTSSRYAIRTPGRSLKRPLAEGRLTYPFHFTDRTLFDAHLLDLARGAGAEVRETTAVATCDPDSGTVTLSDGVTVQGQWVIGADGANSVVRRSLPGVDRARFRRAMAPALEVHLDPADFPRRVEHPELYIGMLKAGYGWVFPNRDRVLVGVCGLRREGENFADILRDYLVSLGVKHKAVPDFKGHPLPYGNYLEKSAHGRVLLAGDAAGLVEPLFGEGIFFALCSGLYAGEAVAHADPAAYVARLRKQVLPELRASNQLRWALFQAMNLGGTGGIGLFVRSLARPLSEMVHGIRSYSWLRKKHWDFMEQEVPPAAGGRRGKNL